MFRIEVSLDGTVYTAFRAASRDIGEQRLASRVVDAVGELPAFGAEAEFIVKEPAEWFALDRMADAEFWVGQDRLRQHLEDQLAASVDTITPYLPEVARPRVLEIVVHPVPGLTTCYGAPEGGQLFGLYHGADPREMMLFLSHTYYHELSGALDTELSRLAEADPSTAAQFRHWLLLLIRNEGIANYAVLGPLRELRRVGVDFRYFRYAGLIDNAGATERAMAACLELLRMLDDSTVRNVARRVSAVLKNPRLPVINLIGIHMAEVIAERFGERALLDVDQREPQEFFASYADSDDPLRQHLFGPDDGDGRDVFGLLSAEPSARPS